MTNKRLLKAEARYRKAVRRLEWSRKLFGSCRLTSHLTHKADLAGLAWELQYQHDIYEGKING
jgi:hypothetical protein